MEEFDFSFVKGSDLLKDFSGDIDKVIDFYKQGEYNEMIFNARRVIECLAAKLVELNGLQNDRNSGYGLSEKLAALRSDAKYPARIMRLFDRLRTYGTIAVHATAKIDAWSAQVALMNFHDLLAYMVSFHEQKRVKYADILLNGFVRK